MCLVYVQVQQVMYRKSCCTTRIDNGPKPCYGVAMKQYPIRRTVPLMLAGVCGVLMALGWPLLGVLCAVGATYAVHDLVECVRKER